MMIHRYRKFYIDIANLKRLCTKNESILIIVQIIIINVKTLKKRNNNKIIKFFE